MSFYVTEFTVESRLSPGGLFVCEVGGSAPALMRRYPELPFIWPDLPEGGEGVFLLTAESLGIRSMSRSRRAGMFVSSHCRTSST